MKLKILSFVVLCATVGCAQEVSPPPPAVAAMTDTAEQCPAGVEARCNIYRHCTGPTSGPCGDVYVVNGSGRRMDITVASPRQQTFTLAAGARSNPVYYLQMSQCQHPVQIVSCTPR